MKVKYIDSYESVRIVLPQHNLDQRFVRNRVYEVSNLIGMFLLRSSAFITECPSAFKQEWIKTPNIPIYLKRFGALGDLIQLLPITRYLKRKYNLKIVLVTEDKYVDIFKPEKDAFDDVISFHNLGVNEIQRIVFLDGVLERDHSVINTERSIHRIKLYERTFGIDIDEYDFHLTISPKDRQIAESIANVTHQ